METFWEFIKLLVPVLAVGGMTVYLILNRKDKEQALVGELELKKHEAKTLLPLILQAYERLTLFLERISVENLVMRVHEQGMSAKLFHTKLINAISDEFEHNIAQQIYVSEEAWDKLKKAKDDVIRVINRAGNQVGPNGTGIQLSQKIFEIMSEEEDPLTHVARRYLKQELNTRLKYYK